MLNHSSNMLHWPVLTLTSNIFTTLDIEIPGPAIVGLANAMFVGTNAVPPGVETCKGVKENKGLISNVVVELILNVHKILHLVPRS